MRLAKALKLDPEALFPHLHRGGVDPAAPQAPPAAPQAPPPADDAAGCSTQAGQEVEELTGPDEHPAQGEHAADAGVNEDVDADEESTGTGYSGVPYVPELMPSEEHASHLDMCTADAHPGYEASIQLLHCMQGEEDEAIAENLDAENDLFGTLYVITGYLGFYLGVLAYRKRWHIQAS